MCEYLDFCSTGKVSDCATWRPLSKKAAVTADIIWGDTVRPIA
jgi:hypothetical protein